VYLFDGAKVRALPREAVSDKSGESSMRRQLLVTAGLVALVLASTGAGQDEPVPEYPKVGSVIPGPFHVLNLNGERKSRFHCLVCRSSIRPTAAILARLRTNDTDDGLNQLDPDQPLAKLVKAVDGISDKYPDAYMGTFFVLLSDKEDDVEPLKVKMETLTKEARLKQIVFAFDNKAEAKNYFADPQKADADGKGLKWGDPGIKVLLYANHRVIESHDFTPDKPLTDKDVAAITATFRKMVPDSFTEKKVKPALP
jgi:hypothetical protein